jgi:acetyl esterase
VTSVGYRLAPEAPFPAAVQDVVAAYEWVVAQAEALGIDAHRIAAAGDSAGGNLSAVIALAMRGKRGAPALQALLYPALEGTNTRPSHRLVGDRYYLTAPMVDWYYRHYAGSADRTDPRLSPMCEPDLTGVCPALVYTCAYDPLVDEGDAYAERLRAAGALATHRRFDDLVHGFALMAGAIPACERALETVAADLLGALPASRGEMRL